MIVKVIRDKIIRKYKKSKFWLCALLRIGKGKEGFRRQNETGVAGADWWSGSIDEHASERRGRGGCGLAKDSEIALMGSVPDCD